MSQTIKRFWKAVEVAAYGPDGHYAVMLDGRPFRLPGGNSLTTSSARLADAIAAEWRAIPEGEAFRTADLPMTQMAGTEIERVRPDREQIIGGLSAYGENDLLCYRAVGSLGREQDALFDPVLALFGSRHGVLPQVTRSLLPLSIAPELQKAYGAALERMDDAALTCAAICAPATGSLILAIGLVEGWVDAASARLMASVEERHQMAQWGEDDALIQEIDRNAADVEIALRYLELSYGAETNQA